MVRILLSLAALALLTLALLAGCDQLGNGTLIIGSLFTNYAIEGGTDFHVLVLASDTVLDPVAEGAVDAVETVARYDGSYPGDAGDDHYTTNYIITGVPAGTYYVFAWIDDFDNDEFDSNDFYGFYDGLDTSTTQSEAAIVVVPATGAVDVDVYMIFPS
ncbi:MAG: hypothetical protein A2177_08970 [Spirochaetes bacterium RBG_13_68_11]|nr:MAG: hypothetical protein A2177_08970 [Spirochaetes bacterium RBG_13_68_11]